jgi:hypothetical protein
MTDAETNYADVLTSMAADGHGYFAQADITRLHLAADQISILRFDRDRASDEIKRLRAALREIAGGKHYADDPWSIARAALAGENTDD